MPRRVARTVLRGDRRGNPPVLPGTRESLRTETTVNDTRDFSIGKRLTNLPALREIGFSANGVCCTSNDSATTRSPAPPPARHHRPGRHGARTRPAAGRPAQPRPAVRTAGVPLPAQRIHQLRPARAHRTARRRPPAPGHLRSGPATASRADHPHPGQKPLPAHRPRPGARRNSTPHCTTASYAPNSPPTSHPPRDHCPQGIAHHHLHNTETIDRARLLPNAA